LQFDYIAALKEQDMFGHFDVILSNDINKYKVDVKGFKRKERTSNFLVDEMWIEYYNVRGDKGWIHGKADWIAQRTDDHTFYIFDRKSLLEQTNSLIQWKLPMVTSASQALYRLYQRQNRQDIITRIKLQDVKPLFIWE
jgi:hypothetical protein